MKYRPIFITATNTGIGKTYATCRLIETLSHKGLHVGVLKPIETGVKEFPIDGKLLLETAQKYNKKLKNFTCRDVAPVQFLLPASPYVSREGKKIDFKAINLAYEKMLHVSDIVLIEGAGGLMVPVDEKIYMYDFIKKFNAITLLVTHANLGCINDTLLNRKILDSLKVEYQWCINFKENKNSFQTTTLPYYKKIISLQDDIKILSDNLLKLKK
ncbi:MAG: dethiobiotin synthase [Sulfurospirillum sp.]|nr:dethiobiotin synthase [Sulfurospirillum sp.]MBL0702502.1 dethiobiotin synthase [Sulfurospirillum sp.]